MQAVGAALASAAQDCDAPDPVAVLCGPGANGGDGFAAAEHLRKAGRTVFVHALAQAESASRLAGDAARAAAEWGGPVMPLSAESLSGAGLVIDALFGAGLSRPLEGAAVALADASHRLNVPVIAADLPSGLHGDLGAPLAGGPCFRADVTVTFFRKKPAHVLLPGWALCGEVIVADIGIPDSLLARLGVEMWENGPALWRAAYPWPALETNKHRRGRLAVLCGPRQETGAARLAVAGGRRAGAGFTTLFGEADALDIAATHETGAVLRAAGRGAETAQAIREFGARAAVLGPGARRDAPTRALVLDLLAEGPALVLDADALSVFADAPEALLSALRPDCVLTPHEGEFARLFPDLALAESPAARSKIDRARAAAARAGCTVLLKGADTVIAGPPLGAENGRAVVNTEGAPWLASAGTGDVLAGIIGGLMAQGMAAFDAACAGAWLHGRAGRMFGPGLIAEDLPDTLPAVLRELLAFSPD